MSRHLYDLEEEEEEDSFDEAKLLDYVRALSIDHDGDPDRMPLAQCETADDTGDASLVGEDHRRKRAGAEEKKSKPRGEQNESCVLVTEFGEKVSLFLPGFDVETSEEQVSQADRDGDDPSEGGGSSLPHQEGKQAPERSDTQKRRRSKCQPEEDEEESVCESPEAQVRKKKVDKLKAKGKKKSDEEKRMQKGNQDSAKEELEGEPMKPRSDTAFLGGTECRSEVDRVRTLMRKEVEQLKLEFDLELKAERKKVAEAQEEREQLWRLYQEEMRHSLKLDYEERLEKLREEHRTELNNFQEQCRNEVSAQRRSLMSALQEEQERLQASNAEHLEELRLEFQMQREQLQLEQSRQMSELQRLGEQLERRAEELRRTEDAALQTRDKLDQITKASDRLRRERDELRWELQKVAAEAEEARDLLQKTQQERDEARTDEVLLKLERDKAVQMCATAVDEGEQLKKKYKNLEKGCAQEKPQKSSSPSLDTRKTEQTSRRRASSSEDGDSSSLTGDTVGCRTSSKAQREGGDKTLDTEKATHAKNQRNDLEETEDDIRKQMEALSNLKQEREHIKAELQNMIEENSKENMDMALVRTEVLMKKRDRLMAQRIREDNERTIHSRFPTLEGDGATMRKRNSLGAASLPWIGVNRRVLAGYCGPREPGYSLRRRLHPGTAKDLLPMAAVKPTHFSHVSPSVGDLRVTQRPVEVGSNKVEQLLESTRRWLVMHGKDVNT